jgi:hypothetical protein
MALWPWQSMVVPQEVHILEAKVQMGFTTKFVTRFGTFVRILKDQWNY